MPEKAEGAPEPDNEKLVVEDVSRVPDDEQVHAVTSADVSGPVQRDGIVAMQRRYGRLPIRRRR